MHSTFNTLVDVDNHMVYAKTLAVTIILLLLLRAGYVTRIRGETRGFAYWIIVLISAALVSLLPIITTVGTLLAKVVLTIAEQFDISGAGLVSFVGLVLVVTMFFVHRKYRKWWSFLLLAAAFAPFNHAEWTQSFVDHYSTAAVWLVDHFVSFIGWLHGIDANISGV